ncbi:hypothetical protein HPB51_021983 [Rhipicephalus microplus]|uniref:Transposable element P transposase n=1 Tax=Rhipicephalus microplus TaxID=6941 RepID=A0A9J6DWJ6_RHIMP|nr:hypothetical protein HPB51_021983 [Rhipicephalus microplus]
MTLQTNLAQPTCVGNCVSRETCPDLIFTKNIRHADWFISEETFGSDHRCIPNTTFSTQPLQLPIAHAHVPNWEAFRQSLPDSPILEIGYSQWAHSVLETLRKHYTKLKLKDSHPDVDSPLLHLWEARRSLSKRWCRQKQNSKLRIQILDLTQKAADLFPNCPSYLSRSTTVVREGPEEKRLRLEGESLQKAIRQSAEARKEEKKKNNISTFEDLLTALTSFQTNTFWTKLVTHDKVLFLNFDSQKAPTVRFSVTVSSDLIVKVFVGDVQRNKLGTLVLPVYLCDLREIDKVLIAVQSLAGNFSDSEERLQTVMKKTVETLDELASQSFPHEWQVEVVKFVKEQVGILLSRTSRYPVDLLVFASLVFTISPHAYRFLRSTSKLKLPHPDTIRRACGSYRVNPCSEQQNALFLSYAKRLAVGMDDHEKTVTLVMDKIHLQPYIDYKGGGQVGMATNSQNAAKTAYVFMIQSLLSSSKDVVHILPVAKLDAIQLHQFLRELNNGLEATGFRVIAVVSDNNSINGKAMSFFSEPRKVDTVYKHPSDQSRRLFFILDTVHVLKCIRNNWLNQRYSGKCMFFPDTNGLPDKPCVLTASFNTLLELHERERNELVRLAPTLSLKALKPSNLGRQNMKLVLKVFNSFTIAALNSAQAAERQHAKSTADFISTVLMWWRLVNVKTPDKRRHLRDDLQEPIKAVCCP